MSKFISPKLTITANGQGTGVTNPGPSSVALNLSATPTGTTTTVTAFETKIVVTTTSPVLFHDASTVGECLLYLKNTSTQDIYLGTNAEMQGGTGRYLTMKAGDFAYMPWSDDTDIYVDGIAADLTMEYFAFKRTV